MNKEPKETSSNLILQSLLKYKDLDPVLIAPSGVAYAQALVIAKYIDACAEGLVIHKIAMPFRQDLIVGSMIEGEGPVWYEHVLAKLGMQPDDLGARIQSERAQSQKELEKIRGGRMLTTLANRLVIYLDDGLLPQPVLGSVVKFLKKKTCAKLVFATSVPNPNRFKINDSRIDEYIFYGEPPSELGLSGIHEDWIAINSGALNGVNNMKPNFETVDPTRVCRD